MKSIVYTASSRGHADHGWLNARHTFSFAGYYEPTRMHFGVLRVINDDIIAPGVGFGTHPHDNMEIITIPLYGDLQHKDSMGHEEVIRSGEVQVMSAGSGITHSEYNASGENELNLFQIWIFPDKQNVKPRYEQKLFDPVKNQFRLVVSPDSEDQSLWIHQQAWFSIGAFDKNYNTSYTVRKKGNGVYAMVIEGQFMIGDQKLDKRDGIGIWEADSFDITALTDNARILLMDVPMQT